MTTPAPDLADARRAISTAHVLGSDVAMVNVAHAKRVQDALDALLAMLDQRETTARRAYDEIRDRISEEERTIRDGGIPAMSTEEMARERRELARASSRWTEAQEARAAAARIAKR